MTDDTGATVDEEDKVVCVLYSMIVEMTVETETTVVGVATHFELASHCEKKIGGCGSVSILGLLELVDFDDDTVRQEQALEILAGCFAHGSTKDGNWVKPEISLYRTQYAVATTPYSLNVKRQASLTHCVAKATPACRNRRVVRKCIIAEGT